jgi:hypothetical protein
VLKSCHTVRLITRTFAAGASRLPSLFTVVKEEEEEEEEEVL